MCKCPSVFLNVHYSTLKINEKCECSNWNFVSNEVCHLSSLCCVLSLAWWLSAIAIPGCRQIYAGWPSWLNVFMSLEISTGVTNRRFCWQPQWVLYLSGIFRAHIYASEGSRFAQGCFLKRHTTWWILQRIKLICILINLAASISGSFCNICWPFTALIYI